MAIFRKKPATEGENGEVAPKFEPQPEKAAKWFDHARSMADRYDYSAALFYYANGIKLDPTTMSAHEAMYEAAIQYTNRGLSAASSKEVKSVGDDHAVAKFAAAEFAWMKDLRNASRALDALDAAIKAEQHEVGHWMASRMLSVIRNQKKPSKSQLIKAKDLFAEVGAWDQAIAAGEGAMQIDPTDSSLAQEIKDLSAQRAMDQGGYERAAGQEGAFRTFVKDADRQQELQEAESISGGTAEERNLARAKAAFEMKPDDRDTLNVYAQLLKKSGKPEDEQLAHDIYMRGFEASNEYRFRMAAGDIRIDQLRRRERALQKKLDDRSADPALSDEYESVRRKRLELQRDEYRDRVEKYPTDRTIRYEFGRVTFELADYDEAMACFQSSKDEPKLRVRAGHMLGRCFAAEGWHLEAIAEYKEALHAMDASERDLELGIRYDLMLSLIEEARNEKSDEHAREAREIASGIARRDITYRDIRAKRKEIDDLSKEIGGG